MSTFTKEGLIEAKNEIIKNRDILCEYGDTVIKNWDSLVQSGGLQSAKFDAAIEEGVINDIKSFRERLAQYSSELTDKLQVVIDNLEQSGETVYEVLGS